MLNDFVDVNCRELSDAEKAVWLVMFRRADVDNCVTISHGRIAETLGKHRSAVRRSMKSLLVKGIVQVIKKGGPDHTNNRYQLLKSQAKNT